MQYVFQKDDMDILRSFIEEASDYLDGFEKDLLKLETDFNNSELVNGMFRRVHSIKGVSSFLSLVVITKLSHEIEFALDRLRKKMLVPSAKLVDCLLESIDLLASFIYAIQDELKDADNQLKNTGVFTFSLSTDEKVETCIADIQSLLETNLEPQESTAKDEVTLTAENMLHPDSILSSPEFKNKVSGDFKEQFVIEAFEHLERIENDLLIKLDKQNNDFEAVNDLFRSVHSIKGGTGIVISVLDNASPIHELIKEISLVTHAFEGLLSIHRDNRVCITKEIMDLAYETVDYLKVAINFVSQDMYADIPVQAILAKIDKYTKVALKLAAEGNTDRDKNQGSKASSAVQNNVQSQSIRVNQDKIDNLMNMIAELIITKNSFSHIARKLSLEYNIPELSKEVKEVGFAVDRISDELQNTVMSIRMVEIKTLFQKIPRIIRDVSQISDKKINLVIEGETTEVDKTIIEQINDPLVHIIRNAADHGIESPAERISKGKNEVGTISLRAYNKNKYVYIEIRDDGKGIDHEELRKKAIDKGFIKGQDAEKMSKSQLLNLIFLPGFSTAKKVTEVSGRGVGMDIVRSNIAKIQGSIQVESEVGKGTTMLIQLPLTLAVSRGLQVEVAKENYIVPIENIVELVKFKSSDIHDINGKSFAYLRGQVVGLTWLSEVMLLGSRSEGEELSAVVVSDGLTKLAVVVDKLKNEQEFVVKPLRDCLANVPGISGSTLLGNGQVVLILNPGEIIKMAENIDDAAILN